MNVPLVGQHKSHRWVNMKTTGGPRLRKLLQLKTSRDIYERKTRLNHFISDSHHALPRKRLMISVGIRPHLCVFFPIGNASILDTPLVTELGRMPIYIYIYIYVYIFLTMTEGMVMMIIILYV